MVVSGRKLMTTAKVNYYDDYECDDDDDDDCERLCVHKVAA